MQDFEPTWGRVLSVWWLVFWRGLLGAAALGGVAGFIIGFVGAMIGVSMELISSVSLALGGIIGLLWSIMVTRMALRKQYGGFRIALVPR